MGERTIHLELADTLLNPKLAKLRLVVVVGDSTETHNEILGKRVFSVSKFVTSMGKMTSIAFLAVAVLLEVFAKLRLVLVSNREQLPLS